MGKRKASKVRLDIQKKENFNNEEMIAKYQETKDINIRNEIVIDNIPLLFSVIKEFALNDKSYYPDLIADSYLVLIESIDGYDGETAKFSTYLTRVLKNKIIDMIARYEGGNCSIHYGSMVARYHYLAKTIFEDEDAIYDEENMDYVLKIMLEEKTTNPTAIMAVKIIIHCISKRATEEEIENVIDEEFDKEREEKIDFIREHYDQLFAGLNEFDTELIKYRYGLIDGEPHPVKEMAKRYRLSRQAIQAHEKAALENMRLRTEQYR